MRNKIKVYVVANNREQFIKFKKENSDKTLFEYIYLYNDGQLEDVYKPNYIIIGGSDIELIGKIEKIGDNISDMLRVPFIF